jgi:hypothetical protein
MVHPILVKAILQPALQSVRTKNEGVGHQVGDDVGKASGRGERGDVQCACVRWHHALNIGQSSNDGFGGWGDVGRRGRQHEEMAGGARVKDGPILEGIHIQVHGAK